MPSCTSLNLFTFYYLLWNLNKILFFFFFFPFNNISQAFPLLLEQRAWNVRICLELNIFFHFLLMTLFSVYPEIVVKIHCKSKQQCSEKFVLSEIGHVQRIVITQFPCWCRLCTIMKYILHLMIPKQLSNCHSTDKSLCSRTFKAAAGSPHFPAEIINRMQIHQLNKHQVFVPKLFLSGRSQLIHCPNILTYSYYFSIKKNKINSMTCLSLFTLKYHKVEPYFWMNLLYWCRWETLASGLWLLTPVKIAEHSVKDHGWKIRFHYAWVAKSIYFYLRTGSWKQNKTKQKQQQQQPTHQINTQLPSRITVSFTSDGCMWFYF